MAKLLVKFDNGEKQEFPIKKDKMLIGRKSNCDVPIKDASVSGKHAEIVSVQGDFFIEDLGSTNGTYVNNVKTNKRPLRNGDVIKLGQCLIEFNLGVQEVSSVDDDTDDRTVLIQPSSPEVAMKVAEKMDNAVGQLTSNAAVITDPSPSLNSGSGAHDINGTRAGKLPIGRLLVLNGPIAGKELLLDKQLVTLGKPGQQVAAISRRPQGYFLAHIESDGDGRRYPVVNGLSIGAKAYELKDSDTIELAGVKMTFSRESA